MLQSAGAPNSRVLLIDTDSQGHTTLVTTGRNNYGVHDSLYSVLMAERPQAARRYWATWLLRDFVSGYESDGMIPCLVVPIERASVFRQAKENSARMDLTAIAMARQSALLVLAVNGHEIPNQAVTQDFYRQALELRIPRGSAAEMGRFQGKRSMSCRQGL